MSPYIHSSFCHYFLTGSQKLSDMYILFLALYPQVCPQRSFCPYRLTLTPTVHRRSSTETKCLLRNSIKMLSARRYSNRICKSATHKISLLWTSFMVNDMINLAIDLYFWNTLVKEEHFYSFVLIKKHTRKELSLQDFWTYLTTNLWSFVCAYASSFIFHFHLKSLEIYHAHQDTWYYYAFFA